MANNGNGAASGLKVPARNNYFYGKLLDTYHFQLEQRYFNEKRWLINRLGLGTGVLCGLELALAEDGQLVIRPGVALDGLGREIIVSAPYCIEQPLQPTDKHGKAVGEPISAPGAVTICLYYHECLSEPVPVMVGECSTDQSCAANRIDERFRVQVIAGAPKEMIAGLPDEVCAAIFPKTEQDESFNRFATACETLVDDCTVPSPTCVVLGVVTLDEDGNIGVDRCSYRPVVYSNAELLELLFCLAGRVDACCVVRQLRYVSGDAQTAVPAATLPEPLVVEVVDGEGNPVAGETVFFRVRGGGGKIVGPDKMDSLANGQARAGWELGPNPGLNTLEARLENGSHTIFHALGVAEDDGEVELPPVVETVWPPNATTFTPQPESEVEKRWLELWNEAPQLEITFDRRMNEAQLKSSADWLGVWQLQDKGEIVVRRIELELIDIREEAILGTEGVTAVYRLVEVDSQTSARYALLMNATQDSIVDLSTPPLTLDADYRGSKLSAASRKLLWSITAEQVFGRRTLWNQLVDTGNTLPQSGDGDETGAFDGWFAVSEEG